MADDRELAEATAQSSLSFAEFLDRMKDPAAADLVRSIKNFIKTYEERKIPDPDTDSQLVQQFLAKSEGAFRQHPVWASGPSEHQAQAIEGLEKYLMTKIYHKSFAVSPIDRERDEALSVRMAALNFIRPEHLDIPLCFQNEDAWLLAMKELHKINSYKAPRDKLVCVLNCCRIINNLLHTSNTQGEARGADDFLPILIYIVIHANPPQLSSNLEYIQRFRMQSRMVSESSYFFTQLYSAASFIETINTNSLTMDADEFVARMVAAGVPDMQLLPEPQHKPTAFKPLPRLDTLKTPRGAAGSEGSGPEPRGSGAQSDAAPSGVVVPPLNASSLAPASMSSSETIPSILPSTGPSAALPTLEEIERLGIQQVLDAEANGELRRRNPYIYSSANDLRVADVESLLVAYKHLVLRYEALSLGFVQHRSGATATAGARSHPGFADAPPAVSGPNPFAGGPNPFGSEAAQHPPPVASPASPRPTPQPPSPGRGGSGGEGTRLLRVADSNPFPSLAASHRQSLNQASVTNASTAELAQTLPLATTQSQADLMNSASLTVPAMQPSSVPKPQPTLTPIASTSTPTTAAPTTAAAAAIAAVTASRTSSSTDNPMMRNYSNTYSDQRVLSTVPSGDVSVPSELQAQLRQGWSNMAEHNEAVAASRSTSPGSQPSGPHASLGTSNTEEMPPTGVQFPLCPIPSLFDGEEGSQAGEASEASLSHLSQSVPNPFSGTQEATSAADPLPPALTASSSGVSFPAASQAAVTSTGPSSQAAIQVVPPTVATLSAHSSISGGTLDPTAGIPRPPTSPPDLHEASVGAVLTGFDGSPFAESAHDSFAKSSNSDESHPKTLPATPPSHAHSESLI